MSEMVFIETEKQAMDAWDREGVVIREAATGDYIVYPRLQRGCWYPEFDLRNECMLMRVPTLKEARTWAYMNSYDSTFVA